MALPAFFVDNIEVEASDTAVLRGNTVSDLQADAKVTGIEVDGFTNLRAKNNKVVRLNSKTESIGFDIKNMFNYDNNTEDLLNKVSSWVWMGSNIELWASK